MCTIAFTSVFEGSFQPFLYRVAPPYSSSLSLRQLRQQRLVIVLPSVPSGAFDHTSAKRWSQTPRLNSSVHESNSTHAIRPY